jgi:DNA-binding CsgD family transcriptional regulator
VDDLALTNALLDEARTLFGAGRPRDSVEACLAAADVARGLRRWDLIAEAALVVEGISDVETDAAIERLCREALAGLEVASDDASRPAGATETVASAAEDGLLARLHAQLAISLAHRSRGSGASDHSRRALVLAEGSDDPAVILRVLHAREMVVAGPWGADEVIDLGARTIALSERTGSPEAELWGRVWRIDGLFQRGEMTALDQEIDSLGVLAQRTGLPLARWHVLRSRASRAHRLGRFDAAEQTAHMARGILPADQHAMTEMMYWSLMVMVGTDRGRRPDAAEEMERMVVGGPPIGRAVVARLDIALGDVDAARAKFDYLRPRLADLPRDVRWLGTMVCAAEVAAGLGDEPTATLLYDRLLPFDGIMTGAPVAFVGPLSETLGWLALGLGHLDLALAHFTAAGEMSARCDTPPSLARARLGLAETLVRRGDDLDRARAIARQARDGARAIGMARILVRADALLRRIGDSARTIAETDRLTRREREVAGLTAEGLSNRQVAEHLTLSERTIESHVQNIMSKLEFHSRAQIAAWAALNGLIGANGSTDRSSLPK